MDISGYISDLLYEHDCVIIPGFGGFICNYQPAEINRELQTIAPPAKAISFNVNLQSNDGLLVNYIATSNSVSFDKAQNIIATWANSAKSLLKNNDELILRNIGKIYSDIEGSLQFTPDNSVNYLKSSFGLKTISAIPIYKEKKIDLPVAPTRSISINKNIFKIAASVFLIAAIAAIVNLMLFGVEIKPLNLNEASVFNFITHIAPAHEPGLKPIPVEVNTTPATVNDSALKSPTPVTSGPAVSWQQSGINNKPSLSAQNNPQGYYIIIGAFVENKNIEAAKARLLKKFPATALFIEKSNRLTRIGYAVGNDFNKATSELQQAQAEDSSIWMLRK